MALAYCCAYVRRKLYDVTQSSAAPIAQEGLIHIQAFYRIEKDIRSHSPDARYAARQEQSKPIIDILEIWLTQSRARVSAKSPTGGALKYIAKYWNGLCLLLVDGRVKLDTDVFEQPLFQVSRVFGGFSRHASTVIA